MTLGLKPFLILACAMALLPGCRALTVNETAFANKIYAGTVDLELVRLYRLSLWRNRTDANLRKELAADLDRNPQLAATVENREAFLDKAANALSPQAEALVLGNRIYYAAGAYSRDFAAGFSTKANVTDLALLAHELVHVWQHQNRDRTGYSLLAIALERLQYKEPYKYEITPGKRFLDYRFEQQGAIMQRYVFMSYWPSDPAALRRHRALLEQEFDLQDFKATLAAAAGS